MKKVHIPFFILTGLILGVFIALVGESFGFSHVNLLPFGGKSWALWTYPLSFSLSFSLASFIFNIKERIKMIIVIFFVNFLLFFMIFGMNLFYNMSPFGG